MAFCFLGARMESEAEILSAVDGASGPQVLGEAGLSATQILTSIVFQCQALALLTLTA